MYNLYQCLIKFDKIYPKKFHPNKENTSDKEAPLLNSSLLVSKDINTSKIHDKRN